MNIYSTWNRFVFTCRTLVWEDSNYAIYYRSQVSYFSFKEGRVCKLLIERSR